MIRFLLKGAILFFFILLASGCPFGNHIPENNIPETEPGDNDVAVTADVISDPFFWGSWIRSGEDDNGYRWYVSDVMVQRPALGDSEFKEADENGFRLWNATVWKVSDNILAGSDYDSGEVDFYLFRLSGADADATVSLLAATEEAEPSGRALSLGALSGIQAVLTNTNIPSDSRILISDEAGMLSSDTVITGDAYNLTIPSQSGVPAAMNTTLIPHFDGEDLGSVVVTNPDRNIKTSFNIRGADRVYVEEEYEIILTFTNIGLESVNGVTYTISPPPGIVFSDSSDNLPLFSTDYQLLSDGSLTGAFSAIPVEGSETIIFGFSAGYLDEYYQVISVPIGISDDQGNHWQDPVSIRFFKETVSLWLDFLYGNGKGVIITPEGESISFSADSEELVIPARIEPYRLVVAGTDYYTGESWYSVGVDNGDRTLYAMSLENALPGVDIYEPNNGEQETTALFHYDLVFGHIERGDLDVFTFYATPEALMVEFEPPGGTYFQALDVTCANAAGGTFRYTEDGSLPVIDSQSWSSPILIDVSKSIRGIVYGGELPEEIVFTEEYELKVPAPFVTPEGEGFRIAVNETSPPGTLLRYRLDGEVPAETDPVCDDGAILTPETGEILKVGAFCTGWSPSFPAGPVFTVGEQGPAGGWIFAVGADGDAWRYKEVFPAASTESFDWAAAREYCGDLDARGFSDWYLPTLEELHQVYAGIVDTDIHHYNGVCWTDSGPEDRPQTAWRFVLYNDWAYGFDKTEEFPVLPVRAF